MKQSNKKNRRGFTLVELLVVIGIIAVLIGILLPVMKRVRESANRTVCGAQLRDIGNVFQMYLTANKGKLPYLNPLPGDPTSVSSYLKKDLTPAALLWDVFEPYSKVGLTTANFKQSRKNIWMCPADKLLTADALHNDAAHIGDTYYEIYGTSYEYNFMMNAFYGKEGARGQGGSRQNITELMPPNAPFREAVDDAKNRNITADKFRVFNDFTYFHGKIGTFGNMNFLFADWHVSDLAGSSSARVNEVSGKK